MPATLTTGAGADSSSIQMGEAVIGSREGRKMTTTPAELEDVVAQINLPQQKIALLTGLTVSTLSRMRHGRIEITDRTMLQLATLARLSNGQRDQIEKLARQLQGERPPYEEG